MENLGKNPMIRGEYTDCSSVVPVIACTVPCDHSPSRSAAARSGPSSMVRPTAREQGGFAPPAKPVFKLPATVPTKRDVPVSYSIHVY